MMNRFRSAPFSDLTCLIAWGWSTASAFDDRANDDAAVRDEMVQGMLES